MLEETHVKNQPLAQFVENKFYLAVINNTAGFNCWPYQWPSLTLLQSAGRISFQVYKTI